MEGAKIRARDEMISVIRPVRLRVERSVFTSPVSSTRCSQAIKRREKRRAGLGAGTVGCLVHSVVFAAAGDGDGSKPLNFHAPRLILTMRKPRSIFVALKKSVVTKLQFSRGKR